MDWSVIWMCLSGGALFLWGAYPRESYEDGYSYDVHERCDASVVCVGEQKTKAFWASTRNAWEDGAAAIRAHECKSTMF